MVEKPVMPVFYGHESRIIYLLTMKAVIDWAVGLYASDLLSQMPLNHWMLMWTRLRRNAAEDSSDVLLIVEWKNWDNRKTGPRQKLTPDMAYNV